MASQPLFTWQQTMIRIKDPKVSIPFYQSNFGLELVQEYHFPESKFSVYFLGRAKQGTIGLKSGTEEAHKVFWDLPGTFLELTHNHGTEDEPDFKYNNGNIEPHRGFGHIAFSCEDVYKVCAELEVRQVKFQKKPDEGRMKGLAFALDPDGYWIEILRRDKSDFEGLNFSQTMIRVKDPVKSLAFYRDILGMKLIEEKHFEEAKFSLYFLASARKGEETETNTKTMYHPILELTHNHGTESDADFAYHNGNDEPRGFGHIGYKVDNLADAVKYLDEHGVAFKKRPEEGRMRGIAFALDPDNYWVELIEHV